MAQKRRSCTQSAPPQPPAARSNGRPLRRGWRFAMSGASPRAARSSGLISTERSASAAGRDCAPDTAAIAERFAELRLCRRRGYALGKARALAGARLRQAAAESALARREWRNGCQCRARSRRRAKRSLPRSVLPSAAGSVRSHAATSNPSRARQGDRSMLRAGHDFALARAIVAMAPRESAVTRRLGERTAAGRDESRFADNTRMLMSAGDTCRREI